MAITDNLVSYYTMSDLTTSTIEDVHGSNDGTKTAANEPNQVDGKIGKAQDFDGTDDYVGLPDEADFKPTTSYSICAWIKLSDKTAVRTIFSNCIATSDSTHGGIVFRILTSGYLSIYHGTGGLDDTQQKVGTIDVTNNAWRFVCVTYNGTTARLYVDGSEDDNGNIDAPSGYKATNNPTIGMWRSGYWGNDHIYKGIIDELGFWSRALTSDEITALYNGSNGLAYPLTTGTSNFFLMF
jgi:hypothetical protein